MEITQEHPKDWWEVEALFDLSFAPGREALSSYRLRDGTEPVAELCLVARDGEGILAGAIRFWPIAIAGQSALLLGPIAVHPTRQGEGLAGHLIRQSLEAAVALGWTRVLLIGDEPYYSRHGFAPIDGVTMPPPTNPARVLARSLTTGAWDGIQGLAKRTNG